MHLSKLIAPISVDKRPVAFHFPSKIQGVRTSSLSMGQVFDKFQGKQWRQKQIRKMTDKVFDHFKTQTGRVNLTFEELYIAVLLVYK
ncbi:hypothetical protein AKJ16_DCAP02938 [Drosera capensis]